MSGDGGDLVLIGGGEHAEVAADAAGDAAPPWRVIGYVDAVRSAALEERGIPWLGSDETARADATTGSFLIAVGGGTNPSLRRAIAARWDAAGVTWAVVVHRSAFVAESAEVGPGAIVLAGAIVNTAARIGSHAIVNTGAIVEHHVDLAPFAHVAPGAVLGGGVTVGDSTFIGLGARVRDHVRVGSGVVVGMGAVVVGDVPDGTTVVGMPARAV